MHRFTLFFAAVVALTLGTAAPASAHSDAFSSIPADGSTVTDLTQLQFTFAEELAIEITPQTVLTAEDGTTIELGAPSFDATNTVMTVPLVQAPLAAGVYTAATQITSIDGHPASYQITFTATTTAAEQPTATPVPIAEEDTVEAVTTTSAPSGPGLEFALATIASLVIVGTAVLVVVAIRRRRNAVKGEDNSSEVK